MINEGAKILEEGRAARASDIDTIYMTGYGFPAYRGGPMWFADSVGLDKVAARVQEHSIGSTGSCGNLRRCWSVWRRRGKRFASSGWCTQGLTAARPFRDVKLGSREVMVEREAGGVVYVRLAQPLGEYPARMTDKLDYWAEHAPERTYIAKRVYGGEWDGSAIARLARWRGGSAQALVDRGLSAERPIAIVSGNDLEHAMLALGAMYAGVPFSPLSPSYSLLSHGLCKLRHIFGLLTPGLVFAASGTQFEKALNAVMPEDAELVVTTRSAARRDHVFRIAGDGAGRGDRGGPCARGAGYGFQNFVHFGVGGASRRA